VRVARLTTCTRVFCRVRILSRSPFLVHLAKTMLWPHDWGDRPDHVITHDSLLFPHLEMLKPMLTWPCSSSSALIQDSHCGWHVSSEASRPDYEHSTEKTQKRPMASDRRLSHAGQAVQPEDMPVILSISPVVYLVKEREASGLVLPEI
jgi:hypothetical protein